MSRLAEKYQKEVLPILQQELGLTHPLAVPRTVKVVVNVGLKEAAHDEGVLNKVSEELASITGQKPAVRRAKKSIAGFKLVEGNPIGLSVTLRGERMDDFLDKLFNVVLPRVRDFRGASTRSFDGCGNFTLGLAEQIVFPEVDFAKIERIRGLEVTIVTNAGNDEKAKRLLELLGMPFAKDDLAQSKPKKETKNG